MSLIFFKITIVAAEPNKFEIKKKTKLFENNDSLETFAKWMDEIKTHI